MVESAAACPVRGGVSGERPLGRVKVPEGIDEAWRVARDLPAEPWPLVVRLEVRSVEAQGTLCSWCLRLGRGWDTDA